MQVLLGVFQALLDNGATVVVIEHDLDVIRNADYIIDMGPGGGESGGRHSRGRYSSADKAEPKQHYGKIPVKFKLRASRRGDFYIRVLSGKSDPSFREPPSVVFQYAGIPFSRTVSAPFQRFV